MFDDIEAPFMGSVPTVLQIDGEQGRVEINGTNITNCRVTRTFHTDIKNNQSDFKENLIEVAAHEVVINDCNFIDNGDTSSFHFSMYLSTFCFPFFPSSQWVGLI